MLKEQPESIVQNGEQNYDRFKEEDVEGSESEKGEVKIFTFPNCDNTEFKQISGRQQLKRLLNKQFLKTYDTDNQQEFFYQIYSGYAHSRLLRAYCTKCSTWLGWKRVSLTSKFKLTRWQVHHEHEEIDQSIYNAIVTFLSSLPPNMDLMEMSKYVCQKFGCQKSQYNSIVQKYKNPYGSLTLSKLKDFLSSQNCYYFCTQEQQLPNMFLIITPEMRELYWKFGFMIKLDYTFKLIREEVLGVDSQGEPTVKQYAVGFISGINTYNRIIIYGICVTLQETKHYTKMVLERFFNHMQTKCDTIITDQAIGIASAIKQLGDEGKFDGIHVYDIYHILANLQFEHRDVYARLSELYRATSIAEYNSLLALLRQQLRDRPQQLQQLDKFDKMSQKCCMSKIPLSFIGLSCSTGSAEKINHTVKSKIKRSLHYYNCVLQLVKICTQINERSLSIQHCIFELQDYSACHEQYHAIQGLREKLCKSVYRRLIWNYTKSIVLNVDRTIEYPKEEDRIKDQSEQPIAQRKYEKSTIVRDQFGNNFMVHKNRECENPTYSRPWQCECEYWIKTQIPCEHELKCTYDFWRQIGPFWKNQQQHYVEPSKKKITVMIREVQLKKRNYLRGFINNDQ